MDNTIILVALLTFIINYIAILLYAVRIVGIRTGKFAISYALINILAIGSRLANTIQAPLMAKNIEQNLISGTPQLVMDFRIIILAASAGTLAGAISIPTFQRFLAKAVEGFYHHNSMAKLLFKGIGKSGLIHLRSSLTIPHFNNIKQLKKIKEIPLKIILLNVIISALITISVLACLYAGSMIPEFRSTTTSMTGIVNGIATIAAVIFLDPESAVLQDKVIAGEVSEGYFRRFTTAVIVSRFAGTLLAQFLLLPSAKIISTIAQYIGG